MVICVILTPFPFYKNIIFFQADIVLIKVVLYLPNFSLMFLIHVFLYAGVYCMPSVTELARDIQLTDWPRAREHVKLVLWFRARHHLLQRAKITF